jgi:alpha-ribazole phosphatase
MDLILVRHPAVAVPSGVCYGRSDVALASDPQAEVRRCIAVLEALYPSGAGPAGVQAVHASPLARCIRIAGPLAEHLGVPVRRDARLQELDFGRWEMQPWDAIARHEIDAWAQDLEHARSHGGESVAQLAQRAGAWLSELETAAARGSQEAATLALTHAGVMRVLAALALRLPLAACVDWQLGLGAWCRLRYQPARQRWTLLSWNGV